MIQRIMAFHQPNISLNRSHIGENQIRWAPHQLSKIYLPKKSLFSNLVLSESLFTGTKWLVELTILVGV